MPDKIEPALSTEERARLQREAAAAYDAGRMDDARSALDKLGSVGFAEDVAHLVDGTILNKHLPPAP